MRSINAIVSAALIFAAGALIVAAPMSNAKEQDYSIVKLDTTKGPIKIKVFTKDAPITSNNFLDLVKRGFYNGLKFHRYEPGFVVQGGCPLGTGVGNFVDPATKKERHIKLEKVATLKHDAPGTVAMARTEDPNSASCQFYITLKPTQFLDGDGTPANPGYAVFGKVTEGMANVMKLRAGDKMTKVTIEE